MLFLPHDFLFLDTQKDNFFLFRFKTMQLSSDKIIVGRSDVNDFEIWVFKNRV